MVIKFQKPRGTQDILPAEQKYWYWAEDAFRNVMLSAGFGRIIIPTFEHTELFVRGIGESTDVVSKEMYTFEDRGGNSLTLRPEGTAGAVRAYIENGMHKDPQPVKLFYWGPVFRYDRPQAGRFREYWHPGLEMFGEQDPIVDAQVIALMMKFYKRIGLKNLVVKINSIGDAKGRDKMQKALIDFLSAHRRALCPECKRRMVKNPMRVLDCKEKKCQSIAEEAGGVLIDNLNKTSKEHFTKVLEYLDDMGVKYELDHRLVRGLDYYTHTVFEVAESAGGLSIGGGGRYDELVKLLGGEATPAIGFGIGLERTIDLLKKQNVEVPDIISSNVFVIQLGDEAKKKAIKVIDQLDEDGFRVAHALGRGSIKSQLRMANRLGTKIALIIGEQEVHDNSVIIRDLSDSTQETIIDRDMVKMLKKKIHE